MRQDDGDLGGAKKNKTPGEKHLLVIAYRSFRD